MSTSQPSVQTLSEAEISRTLTRIQEREQRTTEVVSCAIVANAMLMDGKITVGHDFICPLSQMIPEDPVSFGGGVYERESVEGYIRTAMTKHLPRRDGIKRHVRDPLNPARIIFTKTGDASPVTDRIELEKILSDIIHEVDSNWENNLKIEVDRAMNNPTTSIRGNDGDDRGQTIGEYFSDLTRRVETANINAMSTETHVPEYPYELVEEIDAVHNKNNKVEVVGVVNNVEANVSIPETNSNDSDGDDSIDREIARVAGGNTVATEGRSNNLSTVTNEVSAGQNARVENENANVRDSNETGRDSNRKLPFPSVNIEAGRNNGYLMMKEAKRFGWDNSLKFDKRITWLKERHTMWFGITGIFRMYRPINPQRLSAHINALTKFAKEKFPSQNHSNDSTGSMGEDIPPFVLLCREWEDHKTSNPSKNVQQQANLFISAVVQQTMLEPMRPLGETGANLRSQVREENIPSNIAELPPASGLLHNRTQITGLVENSGLSTRATTAAVEGVSTALNGITSRVTRLDVISNIELSRERQSARLCESLGSVLNHILHPSRTISDINSDFRNASLHYENASDDNIKEYWRMAMSKLMDELRDA